LRYADDDAAAFHSLISAIAADAHLLTVMDAETQQLYPSLVASSRPPQLAELNTALAELRREIDADHARGDTNAVFIFYSGHGAISPDGDPALALLDFEIDRDFLYSQVLEQLPGDYVHLLIDACHAEAVVRPRDAEAQRVPVSPIEAHAALVNATLSRFPRVGAIVAAASEAEAHEWDTVRHGIFTYELLSAFRGAADVNHDGVIEYSEVFAFLSAANRSVQDPRGRLSVVAHPPDANRRVALVTMSDYANKSARLTGIVSDSGRVDVTDELGRRHASFFSEPGQAVDLLLPTDTQLYVRTGNRDATFKAASGDVVRFATLRFATGTMRARGSIDESLRSGLFASPFGRGYYSGFIDRAPEFVPVPLPALPDEVSPNKRASISRRSDFWRALDGGGGLGSTTRGITDLSFGLRLSLGPHKFAGPLLGIDVTQAETIGREWHARASAGFVWPLNLGGAVRAWAGPTIVGGVFWQASGADTRATGVVGAGPLARVTVDVSQKVGVWLHTELVGTGFRRDGQNTFGLGGSLFAGASAFLE
jgi:hypothetical protein